MRNGLLLPAAFKERHLLSVIANTLYSSLIGQWSVTMPNRAAGHINSSSYAGHWPAIGPVHMHSCDRPARNSQPFLKFALQA